MHQPRTRQAPPPRPRSRRAGVHRLTPLARGAAEAAGLVAAFVAFGLAWVAFAGEGTAPPSPYPPAVSPPPEEGPAGSSPVWLVDGYNVLCAGVLGVRDRTRWWSEANRSQLLELAERFDEHHAELWVVFDGDRSPEGSSTGRVHVVFAAPADDWLLDQVKARAGDEEVALVTADRPLADRARHRGARVVAPREFVRRCMG